MTRPTRSRRGRKAPSLNPQQAPHQVAQEAWYYEDRRGVEVYVRLTLRSDVMTRVRLPWGMLLRSARRCGKVPPSRAKGRTAK